MPPVSQGCLPELMSVYSCSLNCLPAGPTEGRCSAVALASKRALSLIVAFGAFGVRPRATSSAHLRRSQSHPGSDSTPYEHQQHLCPTPSGRTRSLTEAHYKFEHHLCLVPLSPQQVRPPEAGTGRVRFVIEVQPLSQLQLVATAASSSPAPRSPRHQLVVHHPVWRATQHTSWHRRRTSCCCPPTYFTLTVWTMQSSTYRT